MGVLDASDDFAVFLFLLLQVDRTVPSCGEDQFVVEIYKHFGYLLVVTHVVRVGLSIRIVLGFQASSIIADKQFLVVRVQPRECELLLGTDEVSEDLLDLARVHVD